MALNKKMNNEGYPHCLDHEFARHDVQCPSLVQDRNAEHNPKRAETQSLREMNASRPISYSQLIICFSKKLWIPRIMIYSATIHLSMIP